MKLRFSDEKESSGRFLFNRKKKKRRLLHTIGKIRENAYKSEQKSIKITFTVETGEP